MRDIEFELKEVHTPRERQLVHASLLLMRTLLSAQTEAERGADLTPEDEATIDSAVRAYGEACFPDIAFPTTAPPLPG